MVKSPRILTFVATLGIAPAALAQPPAPILVSPAGVTANTVPTFTWNSVSGATDYYFWLNDSGGVMFTQWYPAASVCAGATCSLSPNLVLAEGPYTWWVQAKSGTLVGPWSTAVNFRVSSATQPPGPTTLIAPSGSSSAANVLFTWTVVSTATEYYLWVNSTSGNVFQQWYSAASICVGSTCSVAPGLSLASAQHTWWVQTRNGAGDGPWSNPLQFTQTAASTPPAPLLTAPTGATSNPMPTYTWGSVSPATDYYLWINGPSGILLQQWYTAASICTGSICSVTPSLALANGNHWWWVQAKNGSTTGPWSSGALFTVSGAAQPPAAPTLVSPNGSISTVMPAYRWNAVSLATDYYLWIDGPSSTLLTQWYASSSVCSGQTCSVTPNLTLNPGAHRFWVQARNGSATGPWSAASFFTVTSSIQPPAAPTLISPSGATSTTMPSYSWNAVSTATDYYLWVDGPSGNVLKQWYVSSSVCSGSTCSVTPNVTLGSGGHTWWVQARNSAGTGPWSAPKLFSLSMTPAAPTLIAPSGTLSTTTPTYSWNAVATATDYYLWVNGPSGTVVQQWFAASSVCSAGICSAAPAVSLAMGAHRWWIQARNGAGDGPWSAYLDFQVNGVPSAGLYVDGALAANCTSGNYSIAARNCTGTDGNAYRTIAAGFGALSSGKTLTLRAGTYVENNSTVPTLGSFSLMTTITGHPGELVVWQNNDIYYDHLSLGGNAHNVTVRNINFKGKRYIGSNERQWVLWQGNVWRTTDASRPLKEVIEIKSGCNPSTISCSKTVRTYAGDEKSSPTDLLNTGSDGDFFQNHTTDRVLYVYSSSGDPGERSDLWETGWGITIGNNSTGTGYVVVEQCTFDGQGHVHLKGGYRWKVSKNAFTRVGTDWNDHHIYAWSNLSQGNEAIYEENYFENDAGMGAALHVYGHGGQVANEGPDYHIFRYNLIRGNGFWGVLLDGANSVVSNNSFSLEGQGNRAINLQGFDASFNVIANNIISRPSYIPIVFEGTTGNQPSSNVVQNNLTDAASLTVGTCSGCTITGSRQSVNPGWVNAQPGNWTDFRLAAGSAAIDSGLSLGASHQSGLDPNDNAWPPSTVNQNTYGSGWEIGAFVYR
jgi:hypothetical protein